MRTAPRRRGRPKLSVQNTRSIFEKMRVNKLECKAIKYAAAREGMKRSEWMRKTLLKAAGI